MRRGLILLICAMFLFTASFSAMATDIPYYPDDNASDGCSCPDSDSSDSDTSSPDSTDSGDSWDNGSSGSDYGDGYSGPVYY
ncbi:MAG: hypothetical protein EOM80_14505 [Erysipelotrichia bacterium]|nr:hypothetical protein [Candidatus Riflebacteria bacterium]NCB39972.1 hypothetical protein [Erysipelotrichia bacterium]